jgi:methylated-DNA-[protein]-cysteine S-methyltransferase
LGPFDARCYALLRQIPRGRVTTYREIAHALGTRAYRAVGNALNRNPYDTKDYPCHRVVRSDGSPGGYALGEMAKIAKLLEEGIVICEGKVVDIEVLCIRAEAFEVQDEG